MRSNTVHGEMYSIQHYVIKFVGDLRQVSGFLRVPGSSTNKTDCDDITEIVLKVALNTINQTCLLFNYLCKTIKSFKYKLWCDLSLVVHYFFVSIQHSRWRTWLIIYCILYKIKKSKLIKRKDCSNTTCTVNCQIPGITLCKLCHL